MTHPFSTKPMFTFDEVLCGIEMFGYAKAYRRLYENSKSVIAVSVLTAEHQTLINRKFSTEEEQQQWLEQFNAAIRECGVPEDFITLPDGTFIIEKLVTYAEYRLVGRRHTIELYDHIPSKRPDGKKDKPLVTALVESREAATDFLNYLAARLNKAK